MSDIFDEFDMSSLVDMMNKIDADKEKAASAMENQLKRNLGFSMLQDKNVDENSIIEGVKAAEIKITVNPNHLEASVIVTSPQLGGRDITADELLDAVAAEGIIYGVDEELLRNIATEKMYDTYFTFAYGEPPINGVNGSVKNLYEEVRKLQPKLLEDGSVDFKNLGVVQNISLGDTICEITNETEGTPGRDVYGNAIGAKRGKPPLVPSGANTGLNGDFTKLIALASGNLIFRNHKFEVETVYTVKESVDISTGNIDFLGDVFVGGNVEEGFTITSGKDITVNGMVNGGVLKAIGSITVKNGVVNSVVYSKDGDISIGFGESAKIKCKGNFRANSLVSCTVDIEGSLTCINKPGTIVGGECKTLHSVECNTLGHRNYIATSISVGDVATVSHERLELVQRMEQIDTDISKINTSLDFLQGEKRRGVKLTKEREDFINAAVRLKVQKTLEKNPMQKRILEIDSILNSVHSLNIKVNRYLHPNVKIKLGAFNTVTSQEYGKCVINTNKEDIVIS